MKKVLRRPVRQYIAVFEPDPEVGGYTVTIPALPGCISEGDTFEQATENIQQAATLYLEVMRKRREPVLSSDRGVVIAPIKVAV